MSQFKKKLAAFSAMLAFVSVSGAATYALDISTYNPATGAGNILGKTNNMELSQTAADANGYYSTQMKLNGDIKGDIGQVDLKNYHVTDKETLNYGFSSTSQTIINRVLGGDVARIQGKITNSCTGSGCTNNAASGKVILINPAGFMFDNNSVVDLNSLTVSTHDINGIGNIRGNNAYVNGNTYDVANYKINVLNPLSHNSKIADGQSAVDQYSIIRFDADYTDAFTEAGLNPSALRATAQIKLDGATFDYTPDVAGDLNKNKTVAFIGDKIDYKDSIVKVGGNNNVNASGTHYSMGTVKLYTTDGVTFWYHSTGTAMDNTQSYDLAASNDSKVINIDNTNVDGIGIQGGTVQINNMSTGGTADNPGIKIKNTYIKGRKLVSDMNGDVTIKGLGDVSVIGSRIDSVNTGATLNGVHQDSFERDGGKVIITAGRTLNVDDSAISSAVSKVDTLASTSGDITLDGNIIKIKDTQIAGSDVNIGFDTTDGTMAQSVTLQNAYVNAENKEVNFNNVDNVLVTNKGHNTRLAKNINIKASDEVKLQNSVLQATNGAVDISTISVDEGTINTGSITTVGSTVTTAADGSKVNGTVIMAKDVNLAAGETTLDNASIRYTDGKLSFYAKDAEGNDIYTNNVKVANNAHFADRTWSDADDSWMVKSDLELATNGNLTFDNATLPRVESLTIDVPEDGDTAGNRAWKPQLSNSQNANYDNVTVFSTKGNVTFQNKSNVTANKTLHALSNDTDKKVAVDDSTLNGKDVKLTSDKGKVTIKNNSTVDATNDVIVTSHDTIKFGAATDDTATITKNNTIISGNDMKFIANGKDADNKGNADIISHKSTSPVLTYGGELTFDASHNNEITSDGNLLIVNANLVAGNENNITTATDLQLADVKLSSNTNKITTTDNGGDVVLNNVVITSSDATTTINATGDVTTKDIIANYYGENGLASETTHTYPRSSQITEAGKKKVTDPQDTVLDTNGSKLVIHTSVDRENNASYNANHKLGSVDLNLKNAGRLEDGTLANGLEIVAENTVYDEDAAAKQGPEVRVKAADGNKVAVSKIVTDKLFLNNTKLIAAGTTADANYQNATDENGNAVKLTPTSYIEVRDKLGFDQDQDINYTADPDAFDYLGHYNKTVVSTDEDGNSTFDYGKHVITYDDDTDNTNGQFILVYSKQGECPDIDPLPVITGDPTEPARLRMPRQMTNVSQRAAYLNNTSDPASSIAASAARIDLSESAEAQLSSDTDKDEDELE